ncbi:hypothetical protein LSH36_15g14053 [Paralvinella palmiformis]|uniref:Meckel syndrome type 1 protein n=1 Tax=Paralvinella palmiformis TaxID=53620 RepID=A0AAD9NG09_9ANNE|nr:hypothetical protein LSH36_15g14053 [Paralvinella palmiformis]
MDIKVVCCAFRRYISQMKVVENKPSEDLMKVNRLYIQPVQTMYIVADLTPDGKKPTEADEFVLCTIKYNEKGVIVIRPDFNKGRKAYKIESIGLGRDLFQYTLEHSSPQLTRQEQEQDSKLFREWFNRHADILQSHVGHEFEAPSDLLRVMVYGEIVSAKNFENDDLFVSYFIDLPNGWFAPALQHLSGVTHTCSTKCVGREDVAYFSFPFEFELFYKADSTYDEDGTIRWPLFYVEVSSLDSWQRYRTEGYSHMTLPTTAGCSVQELNCWRPVGRSLISELRRFFVGGNAELEDPTYTAIPSTFEGKHLSKYGFKTVSAGSVTVKFNIVQQSQRSATQVNITSVVEAFKRAKQRMILARENLKKEYIETLKALEVEEH